MAQVLTVRRSVLDLLYQTEVWQPAGSEALVRLDEMAPSHRLNLAKWMMRNASNIRRAESNSMWHFALTLRGEMAQWDAERAIDMHEDEDPKHWIRSTPLYQRLCWLIRRDFAVARDNDPLEVTF